MTLTNPVWLVAADQWTPGVCFDRRAIAPGEMGTRIDWVSWNGSTKSIAQTTVCSAEFHRSVGVAIAAVVAGGSGGIVAPVAASDPRCVVSAATVGGRQKVVLTYQDALTSADLGAPVPLDASPGSPLCGDGGRASYAQRVAQAFAEGGKTLSIES